MTDFRHADNPRPFSQYGGARNPQAGNRFELRSLSLLRAAGWWAQRSPASKSPLDLIAIRPVPLLPAAALVLFIQCKVDGRLDPAPWNELYELARKYGAVPVLVERNSTGREVTWWELTAPKPPGGARGTRGARVMFNIER